MKIAFYKAKKGTLLDYIIDLFSGKDGYSHVELVFEDKEVTKDEKFDATNALCYSISPREKQTRFKRIDITNGHWDIFDLDMKLDEKSIKIETTKQIYINAAYDFMGILFMHVLPFNMDNPFKLYCSECCGKLIQLENYFLTPNAMKTYLVRNKLATKIED